MTRITVPRIVLILAAAIGGFWLLEQVFGLVYRIADILLIFGLAWLLKLLLDPLVRLLRRIHLPRGVSITIAYLVLIGAIVGVFIWMIPQASSVAFRIPAFARDVAARAERGAVWLQERGVEVNPQALTGQIVGLGGQIGSTVAARALTAAQDFFTILGEFALIVTISVYMSLTRGTLSDALRPVIPPRWRDEFDAFVNDVNHAYSSYIRGYFYIVALGTLMSAAILFGFRVPGALLWLILIFAARLLPFIGGTLSDAINIIAVLLGLPIGPAIIATVLVVIGQVLLTHVLMPRVMSRELGINPLLVLFAVLLGGRIYGVAGILFAIPAAAVIATIVGRAINRYLTPLYARQGWWREEITLMQGHTEPETIIVEPISEVPQAPVRPDDGTEVRRDAPRPALKKAT